LLLVLIICQLTLAQQRPSPLLVDELENRVRQASRSKVFYDYESLPDQLEQARRLFARTLRGKDSADVLRQSWAGLGFELLDFQLDDGSKVWLLSEFQNRQIGRGFYAIRPRSSSVTAIQAPHSFADLQTRQLAAALFLGGDFRAAAWNTVHRKRADVAHIEASFFNAFTRAFIDVGYDQAVVCQLHGFASDKRSTDAGRRSDLIVSNGSRSPSFWLYHTARQFRAAFPHLDVRLYPDEVVELGGTTNRQARVLRQAGLGRFLHLEMGVKLRKELINSPSSRADYLKILVQIGRSDEVSAR
jgi:hypothetical protein